MLVAGHETFAAENLIRSTRFAEARRSLLEAVERHPNDQGVLEDAIHLLALSAFQADAERLADRYEAQFGELPDGIDRRSLAELAHDRQLTRRTLEAGERVVFERLTWRERGWPGRYLPFSRRTVKRIEIDDDGIVIARTFKVHKWRWSEVRDAVLEQREAFTAYGYTPVKYVKRLLHLRGPDAALTVDLSFALPEFPRPELVEATLRKHLTVEETELIRADERRTERKNLAVGVALMAVGAIVLLIGR